MNLRADNINILGTLYISTSVIPLALIVLAVIARVVIAISGKNEREQIYIMSDGLHFCKSVSSDVKKIPFIILVVMAWFVNWFVIQR